MRSTTPHNSDSRRRPAHPSPRRSLLVLGRRSRLPASIARTCSGGPDAWISAHRYPGTFRKSGPDTFRSSPPVKGWSNSRGRRRKSRADYTRRTSAQQCGDSRAFGPITSASGTLLDSGETLPIRNEPLATRTCSTSQHLARTTVSCARAARRTRFSPLPQPSAR